MQCCTKGLLYGCVYVPLLLPSPPPPSYAVPTLAARLAGPVQQLGVTPAAGRHLQQGVRQCGCGYGCGRVGVRMCVRAGMQMRVCTHGCKPSYQRGLGSEVAAKGWEQVCHALATKAPCTTQIGPPRYHTARIRWWGTA